MRGFDQYYETMRARYAALAGFSPDEASDIGIRFRALAEQLAGIQNAFDAQCAGLAPDTAVGEALEALAALRGLSRKAAARAAGALTFTRTGSSGTGAITIPAGTLCVTQDGQTFETLADAVIAEGAQAISAPARAVVPGAGGNALAGMIVLPARVIPGGCEVTNPASFTGGRDAEEDFSLRRRLLQSCREPANGANAAFYREKAEGYEGVSSAAVTAGADGIVVSVAADGLTAVPQAVCDGLQDELIALREPCAAPVVQSAVAVVSDLAVGVEPTSGYAAGDVQATLVAELRALLDRLAVGEGLTRARLAGLIHESGLAANFVIRTPAADLPAVVDQVIRPGTVTVTGMEG